MATPLKYQYNYLPVKYLLSSYRALIDGRHGVLHLERLLGEDKLYVSDWKIAWIGTCTILRTAVSLFIKDGKSCLPEKLRFEITAEGKKLTKEKSENPIYHEFLLKERDNLIHQYEWRAYERWLKPDGTYRVPHTIAMMMSAEHDDARPVILMREGFYAGRDSLELLHESADWVEARIYDAIGRAGYHPDEYRNAFDFSEMPKPPKTLLDALSNDDSSSNDK
ncbi:hypothetical protein ACFZ8E_07425 [Methylobacterium sp. HMF5984]|uniref:hypothetical protein n=1 Tax=Methylobacterium sp. HMF5984 TaxID=3367370 RepID=UPI003854626E